MASELALRQRKFDGKSPLIHINITVTEEISSKPSSFFHSINYIAMKYSPKVYTLNHLLAISFSAAVIMICIFRTAEEGFKSLTKDKIVSNTVNTIPRSDNMFNIDKRIVKQKCQDGTNNTCKCTFNENKRVLWYEAHENRIKEIRAELNSSASSYDLDIVILGDSITESFSGRWIIFKRDVKDISEVFKIYFRKSLSGLFLNGLSLGIAADRTVDLLWRIKNGEMPNELNPKIWWIQIGTNDIGISRNCSVETTIQGVLKIVQEIHDRKPNATIVVNSILPRSTTSENGKLGRYWTMIQRINKEMSIIFERIENLYYFNASDIFLNRSEDTTSEYYIPQSLMPDFLHPSKEGYILWSEAIVKWVEEKQKLKLI